jgi:hypothetical protein
MSAGKEISRTAGRAVRPRPISCNRSTTSLIVRESSRSVSYFSKTSRTFSRCLDAIGDFFLICATKGGVSSYKFQRLGW